MNRTIASLADRIEARVGSLAQRALEAMYANPFWDERFGERGRRFAEQDGHYHVRYLVEALRAARPDILTNYARWLQSVLTTRGMCSRHLAENFSRLAEAIREEPIAGSEQAVAYLRAAEDALIYGEGPARYLQLASGELAERAIAALAERHPDWDELSDEAARARYLSDLLQHLSYLADSIALNRPDLFTDYAWWITGFLARRGIPVEHTVLTFAALDEALEAVSGQTQGVARAVLAAGRSALAEM